MTHVYPTSTVIETFVDSAWEDISSDVVSPIQAKQGISGTDPTDRVAFIGRCKMVLDNTADKYTPGGGSVLTGWGRGVPVRITVTYLSTAYNVFWGRVEKIDLDSATWGDQNAEIECLDYMNIASKFPLKETALENDKRIEEGVASLVTALPIAPQNTDYGVGLTTFPTVFDDIGANTRAVAEFQKLAISEIGHIYIKRDDTLKVESFDDRKGTDPLAKVTIVGGFLLKEDGAFLLKEDGGKIELDEATDAVFDNTMTEMDIEYGKGMINEAHITVFPRDVSGSVEVLFNLDRPLRIPANVTLTRKVRYSDPTGGAPTHGFDMITPVATTDYLMNEKEDGSGTDFTASLTISVDFFADGAEVTGNATVGGWVTFFRLRGTLTTKYSPYEILERDAASITAYGVNSISIKQKYQDIGDMGQILAERIVEREREPDIEVTQVRFIANNSDKEMSAFLNIDIGDLVHIKETKNEIDTHYYIYAIEFEITLGGIIDFVYTVKRTRSLLSGGLTAIAVEFAGEGEEQKLRFSTVPQMVEQKKTVIAQIQTDVVKSQNQQIIQITDGETIIGFLNLSLAGDPNNALRFLSREFETDWIDIFSGTDTIAIDTLYTVAVSYDSANISNVPVMYIDGVAVLFTQSKTTSGARRTVTNANRVNIGLIDLDLDRFDGIIKNVRYYNRILTPAEHLLSHTEIITDGLVFQAPNVVTSRLSDYIDQSLAETDKIVDNVFGVVGTPLNTPTGRSA